MGREANDSAFTEPPFVQQNFLEHALFILCSPSKGFFSMLTLMCSFLSPRCILQTQRCMSLNKQNVQRPLR